MRERIEVVASKANACQKTSFAVTYISAQDLCRRLQARADDADKREMLMSGIGGEVGKAKELLSAMREARDDIVQTREEKRRFMSERKARKERFGAIVCDRTMKRQHRFTNSNSGQEEDSPWPRERAPRRNRVTYDNGFSIIAAMLREGDEARTKLEREKL